MTNANRQAPVISPGDVLIAGITENGEVFQEFVKNVDSLWRCFQIHMDGGTINSVIPLKGANG